MTRFRSALRNRESGQAAVEYALLLALVAAGLLICLLLFGTSIGRSYDRVANRIGDPARSEETGAIPSVPAEGGAADLPGSPGAQSGKGNHGCGGGTGGGYGRGGGGGGCGGGGGGKDH